MKANGLRNGVLFVLVVILLLLAWQALTFGRANLHYLVAHNAAKKWREEQIMPSQHELDKALAGAKTARKLHPNNSHYVITYALILEWQGITSGKQINLQQAKKLYIKATQLRPTWPVTWATLAILKWRLNEFDEELLHFLKQAQQHGPNRKEVHEAWAEVGLYLYQQKHPYIATLIKPARQHLLKLIASHDSDYNQSAVNIVTRHNMQRIVCGWMQAAKVSKLSVSQKLC